MNNQIPRPNDVSAGETGPLLSTMPCFEGLEQTFDYSADLICFSHLRWDFVYQRPQHLMSRCAKERRVFFVEEPVFTLESEPRLHSRVEKSGVCIVVPHLPEQTREDSSTVLRSLIDEMCATCRIHDPVLWYYTPMARSFSSHLSACATVYDCMDELSLFSGAPPLLKANEAELLSCADVVFTGGVGLYEAKRHSHTNIHPVPSSIDVNHFKRAREVQEEPADQKHIPRPRLGFAGVIDERFDVELLKLLAAEHPEWQFVMIGPVVKIDPEVLPRHVNIHYLGPRAYDDLPTYFAGWDVALMPFARNEATRYISPTKTPEYLAAGRPVVSTAIRDVVRPYGDLGLVQIADDPKQFAAAIALALTGGADREGLDGWLRQVDEFLEGKSWDGAWLGMMSLLDASIVKNDRVPPLQTSAT